MEYFKEIITLRKWCLWGISSKLFFISSIHHPPLNLEHLLSHGNSTWENIALLVFYHRLPLLSLSKAQLHQHAERKASIFAGSLSDLTPKCLYFFFHLRHLTYSCNKFFIFQTSNRTEDGREDICFVLLLSGNKTPFGSLYNRHKLSNLWSQEKENLFPLELN